MEKLSIIESTIKPENPTPRIFANVANELSKKTLPPLKPKDYENHAIKRVLGNYTKARTHHRFLPISLESISLIWLETQKPTFRKKQGS